MTYNEFLSFSAKENSAVSEKVVGLLNIVTGKIVVFDPITNADRAPLVGEVPVGEYPVSVFVDNTQNSILLIRLEIQQKPVVKWELALLPGQDLQSLEEGTSFGFPVMTGIGCYTDALSADFFKAIQERLQSEMGEEVMAYYDNFLVDALAENDSLFCNHFPSPDSRLNMIVFSVGWNEGTFSSYWGKDENGEIVCLITDTKLTELNP